MTRSRSNHRRLLSLSAATFIAIALPSLVGLTTAGAASPSVSLKGFYLALGASESVGYQPTLTSPDGQPTSDGYANDLVSYEASRGVSLQLTQLGCPGETTTSMINGSDPCYGGRSSQLAQAISFLKAHHNDAGIVSIDIGFNNVAACMRNQQFDASCVSSGLATVAQEIPTILQELKSAAGPSVSFVGLGHYDPYLTAVIQGSGGSQFAAASADAMSRLNDVLRNAYSAASIPMAATGAIFESHDVGIVKIAGVGKVHENVARVCQLTWMCKRAPLGPNIHLDDHGYDDIARAIERALPAPW